MEINQPLQETRAYAFNVKPEDVTSDTLLQGRVALQQWRQGHRAGTDAVLLAREAAPFARGRVADFGAGSGAVGLMVARLCEQERPLEHLTLVEHHPIMAQLARHNLAQNGFHGEVLELDLLAKESERVSKGLALNALDMIVTNPPYDVRGTTRPSPDAARAQAYILPKDGLDLWLRACAASLKQGGRLVMIHRADALGHCLAALKGRFGGVEIIPLHSQLDRPAKRILLHAVKGSRKALELNQGRLMRI